MKVFTPIALLAAEPAFGHIGHVTDMSGHNHWLAISAASAVILILFACWVRARANRTSNDASVGDCLTDARQQ